MPLISGKALDASRFFAKGTPKARASSFDLTIGTIVDDEGQEVNGPFRLKPGEMVQVISAEVFNLSNDVTGHVTYKTDLTKLGISALTVGIVDPGWTGPVATTLLNFSKSEYAITKGAAFLRVSFFEHGKVDSALLPKSVDLLAYLMSIKDNAMTRFPKTFLNQERIAENAGKTVLKRIRDEALVWIAAIAFLFTIIQFGAIAYDRGSLSPPASRIDSLDAKIKEVDSRISRLEAMQKVDRERAKQGLRPPK